MEEILVFVHRVVLVDVLHVWGRLVGSAVAFAALARVRRVAFCAVDVFVAFQDGGLAGVEVAAAVVVVAVAGRVFKDGVVGGLGYLALNGVEIVFVDAEAPLLTVGQTVQTHVLTLARTTLCAERIDHALLGRNTAPEGLCVVARVAHRHAALVEFLAVFQHVLAHVTQVDVEVTALVAVSVVDERVEQPELYILHVVRLEVACVYLAHHSAPPLLRVVQVAIGIQVRIQVVGTALLRIVGHVQNRKGVALALVGVAVRIDFPHEHFPHVVVRKLVEVAFDMTWCKG